MPPQNGCQLTLNPAWVLRIAVQRWRMAVVALSQASNPAYLEFTFSSC